MGTVGGRAILAVVVSEAGATSQTSSDLEANLKLSTLEEENRALRERISALEDRNRELESLVKHDPHTGLPIRRLFDGALEEALANRNGHGDALAVGLIRLDEAYEKIKDNRDRNKVLLFRTAHRIVSVVGETVFQGDRVDEFIVILSGVPNHDSALELCAQIEEAVREPHEGPANDIAFGCHIGLTITTDSDSEGVHLIGNANIALQQSVRSKQGTVLYTVDMGKMYRRRLEIEGAIVSAVRQGFESFRIVYQPLVDRDGVLGGAEALIRWEDPHLGTITPSVFMPIAESTGWVRFIGHWVLYQACRQLKTWISRTGNGEYYVSVNIDPSQLQQPDVVEQVVGVLDSLKLPGSALRLEITERALMERPEEVIEKMAELRSYGIGISVDDFGTGYSSLSYLRRFPLDTLKIDKSFVESVDSSRESREIVRAIVTMAHGLRLETLAEGVEGREQLEALLETGCDRFQGYYFSYPVSAERFGRILQQNERLPAD